MSTPSERMYLRQMELGPMQNFVYLLGDPETRDCVVVDPAWEIDAILEQIQDDEMRLKGILVTHTHQDHVGGHLFGHDIPGIEARRSVPKRDAVVDRTIIEPMLAKPASVIKKPNSETTPLRLSPCSSPPKRVPW